MRLDLLSDLNAARDRREAAILVTRLGDGSQRLVQRAGLSAGDPLFEELERRFRSGSSGQVTDPSGEAHFLTVSVPAPRLVVIGAVHISQALLPMAEIAGFDVTIIDPRTAFASEDRFPARVLRADWPEDVLRAAPLDPYTAVAAVTHDPKIDDFPLMAALNAGCFYVGALGSRKTHARRVERFQAAGLSEDQIGRIRAPIGLAIGAASPAEIAVAVLGEVIGALRLAVARDRT
ncbi:XdhC family protein [Pannonibacter tanglangensis]|uniref:XdhC family protein n=1 Tax=Pannonibacter tanglangensis TaxID=2750084 RepID=A0ABW9ZQJ6_9HYPH|nr:XdhC family protein [Pannonibacter sp. XCT-34]NBN64995.1 XdhC family protein [Pannonibacter sp. XCT-34]